MINLLPPQARHTPLYEYWARTATVWALLICAACVFAFVLLVPTYVLIQLETKAVASETAGLEEVDSKAAQAEDIVSSTNTLVEELRSGNTGPSISAVADAVDSLVSSTIAIQRYQVNRVDGKLSEVQLEGVADDREALVRFEEAIKAHPLFLSADVPLSDLVRSQGLPFSMTITMRDQGEQ